MAEAAKGKWGRLILLYAAAAAGLLYSILTATEAPSPTLAILQYVFLGGVLIGLVHATVMQLSGK